jgi:hypothetical protein
VPRAAVVVPGIVADAYMTAVSRFFGSCGQNQIGQLADIGSHCMWRPILHFEKPARAFALSVMAGPPRRPYGRDIAG